MLARRTLLGMVIAALIALPATAHADPRVVVGTETIQGGEHVFTDQIIVSPGATLIVKDATIWLDGAARNCPIQGSFEFCNPQVLVMPGGKLVADGATFDTHKPVDITKTTDGYSIYTYGGTLDLDKSTFLRMHSIGGEAQGPVASHIRNSYFSRGLRPLVFIRGAEALIEGNTFEWNRLGIHLRDANSTLRNNKIFDTLGYGMDIQTTLVGDKVFPTRATVEGNEVRRVLAGLFTLNSWSSTVRNNVFSDAEIGAVIGVNAGEHIVTYEQIVFEGNRIERTDMAIRSYATINGGQEAPRTIVVPVRNNSITDTRCNAIFVREPLDPELTLQVDARLNWWGSENGPYAADPECIPVDGNAIVDPWLTSDPL